MDFPYSIDNLLVKGLSHYSLPLTCSLTVIPVERFCLTVRKMDCYRRLEGEIGCSKAYTFGRIRSSQTSWSIHLSFFLTYCLFQYSTIAQFRPSGHLSSAQINMPISLFVSSGKDLFLILCQTSHEKCVSIATEYFVLGASYWC